MREVAWTLGFQLTQVIFLHHFLGVEEVLCILQGHQKSQGIRYHDHITRMSHCVDFDCVFVEMAVIVEVSEVHHVQREALEEDTSLFEHEILFFKFLQPHIDEFDSYFLEHLSDGMEQDGFFVVVDERQVSLSVGQMGLQSQEKVLQVLAVIVGNDWPREKLILGLQFLKEEIQFHRSESPSGGNDIVLDFPELLSLFVDHVVVSND